MNKQKTRMTPEGKEQIIRLYFDMGKSVNNIVNTENLAWGVTAIRRVVQEEKVRRAYNEEMRILQAPLNDKEWKSMMRDGVPDFKRAALKELRTIRKLLEVLVQDKECAK